MAAAPARNRSVRSNLDMVAPPRSDVSPAKPAMSALESIRQKPVLQNGLRGFGRLALCLLHQPPEARGRERQRVRLDVEARESSGDSVRDDAADRNDAALAGPLGAQRVPGRGVVLKRDGTDRREVARAGKEIIGKRSAHELAAVVVNEVLEQRAAETLHDRAYRLTV